MFVLLLLFGLGFGASYYQLPAAIPGSYPIAMDPLSSSMVVNNGNNFSYFVRNIRSWSFNRSFVSGQSVALEGDLVAIGGTNVLSLYNLSFAADPVWSMNASCVGLLITDSVVFCGECSYEASAKCAVSIFVQESGNSWRLFDTLQRPDTKTQRFGMTLAGGRNVLLVGDIYWGGLDQGSIFVYERNSTLEKWLLQSRFDGTSGGEELSSGLALSLDEKRGVVGSHAQAFTEFYRDAAGWKVSRVVRDPSFTYFGFSVGLLLDGSIVSLSKEAVSVVSGSEQQNLPVSTGAPYFGSRMASSDSYFAVAAANNQILVFTVQPPPYNSIVLLVTFCVLGAMTLVVVAFFVWFRLFRKKQSYSKI